MKKTFISLFIICFSFLAVAKNGTIKGTFKNAESYKTLYFYEYCGLEFYLIDSTSVANGVFNFNPKKTYTRGIYRLGPKKELSYELVYGKEEVEISADLSDFEKSLKIIKSDENKAYQDYISFIKSVNEKSGNIQKTANGMQGMAQTDPDKYNAEISKLQKKMDSLNNSVNEKYKYFAKLYSSLYIGKLSALLENTDNINKTLLNDPEMAKSTAISIKLFGHFQRKFGNDIQKIEAGITETIAEIKEPSCLEAAYAGMIAYFVQADAKFSQNLYAQLEEKLPNAKYKNQLKMMLPKREPEVGDMAPDITLADTSGIMLSLSQFRGKVILLDFWASWCGPCRRENPNVVKTYAKYKDKGFYVFGVSLDNDGKRWKEAIIKDNLTWAHISDLKGWQSYGAQLYQVKGIPQTYLIDANGKIIAKNLRGVDLELKLESLFADRK